MLIIGVSEPKNNYKYRFYKIFNYLIILVFAVWLFSCTWLYLFNTLYVTFMVKLLTIIMNSIYFSYCTRL